MAVLQRLNDRYRGLSNPLLSERRVELLAVILTLVLVLMLLVGVVRSVLSSRPTAILPAPDSLAVIELPSAGVVSLELSSRVRARPVFWSSRRAVFSDKTVQPMNATAGAAAATALDKLELRGIFGSGDSVGIIALVNGKKKRVMLGDKVVGWKLDAIDGDSVTFVNKGKHKRLSLARSLPASQK